MKIVLIGLLLIVPYCHLFDFNDCYYDDVTNHAAYVCGVAEGENFSRRTHDFLYCNNYSMGIDRADIQILSFPGCKAQEMLWNLLDMFTDLRVINISYTEIELLHPFCLRNGRNLEKVIASHNHLTEISTELFDSTPHLTDMDFSYNQITKLDPFVFDKSRQLKSVNFSFNAIEALHRRLFSNWNELKVLDFNNNRIKRIENDLLVHNFKLTNVFFNNNQIKRLECGFLTTLTQTSLDISLNTLEYFESCSNGEIHIDLNILISPQEHATNLRVFQDQLNWIFSKSDFDNIRHLNLSSSHIENITKTMEKASPLLETLDLSNNFIGELHANTFEKFKNLKKLNLRRTNVTNFEFATFFHQRNLRELDISYNNLNKVDFYLFLRNFQNLQSLNLEGNHLTEIDSVTRSHFPKLSVLGISKNNFSCEYLVKFLLQWHDLKLIDSSSNRTHIGGVDCVQSRKQLNINNVAFAKNIPENLVDQPNSNISYLNVEDLFAIKILLGLIFVVICLFFITSKCKYPLKSIKQRLMNNSLEHSVAYNQKNHMDIQHGLLLTQQME